MRSSHILCRAFQSPSLWDVQVVVRAQMLDQVVLAGKAITAFARAVVDRAVSEDRIMDTGLMALEIGESSK